jgi:hypothetical protein
MGDRQRVRTAARVSGDIEYVEAKVVSKLFHVFSPIDHLATLFRG